MLKSTAVTSAAPIGRESEGWGDRALEGAEFEGKCGGGRQRRRDRAVFRLLLPLPMRLSRVVFFERVECILCYSDVLSCFHVFSDSTRDETSL